MRKLRIVQLESFYTGFLDAYYKRHEWLASQPSALQTSLLLDSGFSGGHNVVPYLNPARWQAHYIIPNCTWIQAKWADEQGMKSAELSARDILAMQIEQIDPDVLYLSDIPGFDFSILERLRRRPVVVGWHATIVDERIAWREIDLLLSGIGPLRERALALGAKAAARYMPAAPAYRMPAAAPRRLDGLVFSGSFAGGIHDERAIQYRAVSRRIGNRSLDINSYGQFPVEPDDRIRFFPPVFGGDVLELYSRYRIVLDSRGQFNLGDGAGGRETSNMRIFETTRAGALLLTEHCSNLGEYFAVGTEIETYGSTEELIDKANFYCADENEEARRKIARAGHERTMKEHLIEHRAIWFERILESHFDLAGRLSAPVSRQRSTPKANIVCTSVGTKNFVFGLDCVLRLRELHPDATVCAHCEDSPSTAMMRRLLPDVDLIENDEYVDAYGDSDESAADESIKAVRMAKLLRTIYPQAVRISYVDSSADLPDGQTLHFDDGDRTVCMLDYGFGHQFGHAAAELGTGSFALLSLAGEAAFAALDAIEAEYTQRSASGRPVRWVDGAADLLAGHGVSVRRLTVNAPWNFSAGAGAEQAGAGTGRVSLFFLIRLNAAGIWEFLSFPGESSWQECYDTMYGPYMRRIQGRIQQYPAIANFGAQSSTLAESMLSAYMLRREFLRQAGYRLLSRDEFESFRGAPMGWDSEDVAAVQHSAFKFLIGEYRAGRGRRDLTSLAAIMDRLLRPGMSVMEEGCGSGYNFEFISEASGMDIRFTGIDLAPAMIAKARVNYPAATFEVMSSDRLGFGDDAFDIVLNGASLMHTVDFSQALAEARRVAGRFVVLHTVTVADMPENVYFSKVAYGSEVVEVCFSSQQLANMLAENRLRPVLLYDSIDYDLAAVTGVPTRAVSIACLCDDEPAAGSKAVGDFNYYCTYFDSNYLARGALMMRSLTAYDPRAFFFVLCLDDTAAKAVRSIGTNMMAVTVDELMAADPEFAASRDNRSQIEWYFTATSSFVNYLLDRYGKLQRLTYLDADLFFYSSPEFLHFEAENASVQIIEHRFGAGLESLEVYGRFNVGWITFTNSEEGRRVVSEYRANCIEWCYDRLEGDRFGDQKYLDRWPENYPHCCISRVKGANVAPWNLSRWTLRSLGPHLFVDEDRLIFFHFQGIRREGPGQYSTSQDRVNFGPYYDLLYAPYLRDLGTMDLALAPLIEKIEVRDIRYNSW